MADEVIVTGAPGGQTIVHFGKKILPGTRFRMTKADAESYGSDIMIVEAVTPPVAVPKPEKRETPSDVLVKQRVVAAEAGRMDRGGQDRTVK